TPASRPDGDMRMRSRPGTSANQARNPRLGAGKASTGRAPAARAAYLAGLVRARHTAMPPFLRCPAGRCALAAPTAGPAPDCAPGRADGVRPENLRNHYTMAAAGIPGQDPVAFVKGSAGFRPGGPAGFGERSRRDSGEESRPDSGQGSRPDSGQGS